MTELSAISPNVPQPLLSEAEYNVVARFLVGQDLVENSNSNLVNENGFYEGPLLHGLPSEQNIESLDVATSPLFSIEAPAAIEADTQQEVSRWRRVGRRVLSATRSGSEAGIIGLEVTPFNEALRFAVLGMAATALDGKSALVGAIYGAATFIIEGLAGLATADVLSRGGARRSRALLNKGLNKVGLHEGAKVNGGIKAAAAFLGGTAVAVFIRDREATEERTFRENAEYGLKTSAALAGVCAVQGWLLDQGIESPSLQTVGGAILGVASIPAVYKWGKRKVNRANEEQEEALKI